MLRHSRRWAPAPIVAAMALAAVFVSSCGAGSDSSRSDNSSSDGPVGSTSAAQEGKEDATSANLHASIADFPLPPGSEVPFPADEYDSGPATVVQFVSVPLPHLEVGKYLFAELPSAGYTVVDKGPGFATTIDGIDPEFGGVIYFETPEGVPGQVTLQVQGDTTGLNFNMFAPGD